MQQFWSQREIQPLDMFVALMMTTRDTNKKYMYCTQYWINFWPNIQVSIISYNTLPYCSSSPDISPSLLGKIGTTINLRSYLGRYLGKPNPEKTNLRYLGTIYKLHICMGIGVKYSTRVRLLQYERQTTQIFIVWADSFYVTR